MIHCCIIDAVRYIFSMFAAVGSDKELLKVKKESAAVMMGGSLNLDGSFETYSKFKGLKLK